MIGDDLFSILENWLFASFFFAFIFFVMGGFLNQHADKTYRIKKGDALQSEKSQPNDADQLKAQKARTIDFLSKLDERFINKEINDKNYQELKAKYENQLKAIEKQIVDAELHE